MFIKKFLSNPYLAITFHIVLGFIARFAPQITTFYYIIVGLSGILDIIRTKDRASTAAYYLFYISSFEIVYRSGKYYLFWEMGKYLCILITIAALLIKKKSFKTSPTFFLFLLLLFPGILTAIYYGYTDVIYLQQVIVYHIMGPIALGIMGIYFYKRHVTEQQIHEFLRLAILPSITMVVFLFLGQKISQIDFISGSNFEASGGFGPNQVSTMLGWGVLILIYGLITKKTLTINRTTDIILLILLLFRGLLTFSRGGMVASVGASFIALLLVSFISPSYRRNIGKLAFRIILALFLLIPVVIIANKLTNNYLLYRYQGKTTNEILTNRKTTQTYLSGREQVIKWEIQAFTEYPFFGVGAGRGTIYRLQNFGELFSSHTEQSRLLGEHGLLGLLILITYFIYLPIWFIFKIRLGVNKHWSAQFYILAMLTMFHAGMRLSMPALSFAIAFIIIIPEIDRFGQGKTENPPLHRQPALRSRHYADHH